MPAFHPRALALLFLSAVSFLHAQTNRITGPIDSARIVALNGNLRPAALRQNDQGRVGADFSLPAMTVFLTPSARQHADLLQLLDQQQNPASPLYHRWLTPEEYANRFGLSPGDTAATVDWLRSRGFSIARASRSRTWIAFSGTAHQVEEAFHTQIHHYLVAGKSHFANATEPSIPFALAGVISGIDGLDDL